MQLGLDELVAQPHIFVVGIGCKRRTFIATLPVFYRCFRRLASKCKAAQKQERNPSHGVVVRGVGLKVMPGFRTAIAGGEDAYLVAHKHDS